MNDREREALLKKIACQREAIRALLQDHIRRYVATSGQSYPLRTKAGNLIDPEYPRRRNDVIELLQRECDELDKAGKPGFRFDAREKV